MLSEIKDLKGSMFDEDIVIVGGGPSSLNLNCEFINNKVVLGCNYRNINIRFDYHVLHDPLSLMWYKKNNVDLKISTVIFSQLITNIKSHNSNKGSMHRERGFSLNPSCHRDVWVGDIPVCEYFNALVCEWNDINRPNKLYSANSPTPETTHISDSIIGSKWFNTGIWCIELAIYFGVSTIYLSGFDGGPAHEYFHPPSDRLVTTKKRTISDYYPYAQRVKELQDDVEIILVNTSNSIYDLPRISV
tara:strand:+ start:7830 stop:8567 length:738 start_codon:yes stop_codon:yes gene_type:complete